MFDIEVGDDIKDTSRNVRNQNFINILLFY